MVKLKTLALLGAGGLALWFLVSKGSGTADASVGSGVGTGGSLAEQLWDSTGGRIFGAPSRNGSTGTSGLGGDLNAGFNSWWNELSGGAFNKDIVASYPPIGGVIQASKIAVPATSTANFIQSVAVSTSLPSSQGRYSVVGNTYTSPQGYKMSVAPMNVAAVAARTYGTPPKVGSTSITPAATGVAPATIFGQVNPFAVKRF